MKSLHHLIPICAVALCTLLMASAAAAASATATSTMHTGMTQTTTFKTTAPVTTIKRSTLATASSTIPHMGVVRENNPQMANQFCIAHWRDSTCRGVLALHDEALKMRQKDGGKLSPEHLKELQSKLDAVLADVQSKLDGARPPSG
jgi:hypothetical protein